jgi:hypothetical protein
MTQQQNDSGRTGIGDDDLDENGQADATPDQAETGGSGGAGLTRNEGNGGPGSVAAPRKERHTATLSGARGAADTTLEQAGGSESGLGTPETSANQSPADLAPAARAPDA